MKSLGLLIFFLLPICAEAGVLHPDAAFGRDHFLSLVQEYERVPDNGYELIQKADPGFELPAVHLIGDVFSGQSTPYPGLVSRDYPLEWIVFAGRMAHAPKSRAFASPSTNQKVGDARLHKVPAPSGAIALISAILLLSLRGKTIHLGASRYQRLPVRRRFTRQARH